MTDNKKGDDGRSEQRATQDAGAAKAGLTRRGALQSIGGGALGAALGMGLPAATAAKSAVATEKLPFTSVRVIELSQTLTGRLTGRRARP